MTGDTAALTESIRSTGLAAGLHGFGICGVAPFETVRAGLRRRIEEGRAGKLRFTFADPVTATDVRRSFPWAERLVVGAHAYLPAAGDPGPPEAGTGRVARFSVDDAYRPLRSALEEVVGVLRDTGHQAEILIDDNRLVDRAAAVRAGVGWWGKNTMVLAPGFGPWLLLGSVATDAPLETTPPMQRGCGTCTACLPACPTGALVAPGVLDASRCLAHWAQVAGVIPLEYREPMGDRFYGCDDCLDACPPGARLRADSTARRGRVDLVWVLSAGDDELLATFERFYIPRNDPRYLRRNALVALGNGGDASHAALLERYVRHRDWLLRLHAAWALGRLVQRGHVDPRPLHEALAVERHDEVRAELHRTRAASSGVRPGDE